MYDTIAGVKRSVSFSTVLTRRPRSLIRSRIFSKFLSLRTTSSLSRAPVVSQRFCLRSKFDSAKPLRRGPWLIRGTSGTGLWRQALVRFVLNLTHAEFFHLCGSLLLFTPFFDYMLVRPGKVSCEIKTMSNDVHNLRQDCLEIPKWHSQPFEGIFVTFFRIYIQLKLT